MATYQKLKASEAPRRTRRGVSRFESVPEWKLMQADISKGLKPGTVLHLSMTAEDKKKYGIKNRRTPVRVITKYIEAKNLPYRVVSFTTDGTDHLQVRYDPKSL